MSDLKPKGWRLVVEERQDLLAFLQSLTPNQWESPSLCAGWRVKDVAGHLLVDEPVQAGMFRRILPLLATGKLSPNQLNAAWISRTRPWTSERIVDMFQEDSVRTVGLVGHLLGAAVALRALVIHHQDMRRPLHMERVLPRDRLVATLDALLARKGSASVGSRSRARGLRLQAVDVGWSHGDGPLVVGPGEAIIMALAGRGVALSALAGDGHAILAKRISSTSAGTEPN